MKSIGNRGEARVFPGSLAKPPSFSEAASSNRNLTTLQAMTFVQTIVGYVSI